MSKNFNFNIGMKFLSFKRFKDTILEHNVLKDGEIRLSKNDYKRCKMVCKYNMKYKHTILCNRVVRTTTFKVSVLFSKHAPGRVFLNKKY